MVLLASSIFSSTLVAFVPQHVEALSMGRSGLVVTDINNAVLAESLLPTGSLVLPQNIAVSFGHTSASTRVRAGLRPMEVVVDQLGFDTGAQPPQMLSTVNRAIGSGSQVLDVKLYGQLGRMIPGQLVCEFTQAGAQFIFPSFTIDVDGDSIPDMFVVRNGGAQTPVVKSTR